ncbi:hypothetical protein Hte_008668 [Hypoxylon texense]
MNRDYQHSPDRYSNGRHRPFNNVRSLDDMHVRSWSPIIMCQPSPAGPSSRHGTTSTSAEIPADSGGRPDALRREMRELNETLEQTRDKVTKLVETLLCQRQQLDAALEKSKYQDAAWGKFFEWSEKEAGEKRGRPAKACTDCGKANADRSTLEREAKNMRLELGHANKRLEYERDVSVVIGRQVESYQRLVEIQHGEIKNGKAKLDATSALVERLRKEIQELKLEKAKNWDASVSASVSADDNGNTP